MRPLNFSKESRDHHYPAPARPGYLRLRCKSCGAEEKREVHDIPHYLTTFSDTVFTHKCDDRNMGVLVLIGGTCNE